MRSSAPFILYKGTKITPGWPIKVLPSSPGKKDGFETLIRNIWVDPVTQKILDIEVVEPDTGHIRNFRTNRIRPYLRNVSTIQNRLEQKNAQRRGDIRDKGLDRTRPRK